MNNDTIRILFLCLFLICIQACDQPNPDHAIRFGLHAAPVTLDPRFATDAVSQRICRLLYQRLVEFDDQFQMVPALAEWRVISPSHFRFHLKSAGRTFHDGSRLHAEDVKATYDFILDASNLSPHRGSLAHIKHIEVIDDDTVDFHLTKADPLLPGRLNFGVLPKNLIDAKHTFNTQPIGSGPLRFLNWPSEGKLFLERLADQQILEFAVVKDPTLRVLKLVRGEIDLLQSNLPQENIQWLRQQDEVMLTTEQGTTFTYLGFNLLDEDTGHLSVRQAIAHALDREAIIQYVMGQAARKAGSLLPPAHWAGHPRLQGYNYDPARSRALLQQAGYGPKRPLHITYKTSNNPFRIRLATIIQHQLREAGIEVEIQSYDWGTFYGDIKQGRFQMYSLSWVGLNLPDIFRYAFHSGSVPPHGANRGRFMDAKVDAIIDEAEIQMDLAQQARLYRELQEYLHEQLPYVPLWYEDNILAMRKDIAGYSLSSDGNYDGMINVRHN